MSDFEIIVKNEKEALKLRLPNEVVERIKEISSLNDEDFKEISNEDILKIIIKSLDKVLYGFKHTQPHEEKETETEHGKVSTEKTENGENKK